MLNAIALHRPRFCRIICTCNLFSRPDTSHDPASRLSRTAYRRYLSQPAMALAHSELRDFERVAHLWYDDGNVILIAGDRGFRVHRGVLMQRSPGFRELFLPLSPNYCSTGACPVLRLPDDPLHLDFALSALYDRFFFGDLDVHHKIPEVASGIISLAHKYDIQVLLKEAIHRLSEAYPRSFEKFNAMSQFQLDPFSADDHASLLSVINVARQLKTSELNTFLPIAFYLCCQLDAIHLVQGVIRSDCSRECLSLDDLRRCVAGRMNLMQANSAATLCLRPSPESLDPCCPMPDSCIESLVALAGDALQEDIFASCDALTNIDRWIEEKGEEGGLCWVCINYMKQRHEEARRQIWDELPKIFEL